MPIQNKKPAPKASSKTDAMKALTDQSAAAAKETKKAGAASASATSSPATSTTTATAKAPFTPPKPAITRKMPAGIIGRSARDEEPEPTADGTREADGESEDGASSGKASAKPKVVFDDLVWQWQELTEDFINTRTGEVRQQNEFTYPTAVNASGGSGSHGGDDEWGGAQDGHDYW